MADSINVDASELNALAVDLGRAGFTAVARSAKHVHDTVDAIAETAKTLTASSHVSGSMTSEMVGVLAGEAGPTWWPAVFEENGTPFRGPRAFMGPACDRHEPDFVDGLADIGSHILRR